MNASVDMPYDLGKGIPASLQQFKCHLFSHSNQFDGQPSMICRTPRHLGMKPMAKCIRTAPQIFLFFSYITPVTRQRSSAPVIIVEGKLYMQDEEKYRCDPRRDKSLPCIHIRMTAERVAEVRLPVTAQGDPYIILYIRLNEELLKDDAEGIQPPGMHIEIKSEIRDLAVDRILCIHIESERDQRGHYEH